MSESRAFLLVMVGVVTLEAGLILGMAALGANNQQLVFGLIIPMMVGAYLISRLVMHYGSKAGDGEG
jgi:hypothetical protein